MSTSTADSPDEEVEQFYNVVKGMLKWTNKHEVNRIVSNYNAKVGKGKLTSNVRDDLMPSQTKKIRLGYRIRI